MRASQAASVKSLKPRVTTPLQQVDQQLRRTTNINPWANSGRVRGLHTGSQAAPVKIQGLLDAGVKIRLHYPIPMLCLAAVCQNNISLSLAVTAGSTSWPSTSQRTQP